MSPSTKNKYVPPFITQTESHCSNPSFDSCSNLVSGGRSLDRDGLPSYWSPESLQDPKSLEPKGGAYNLAGLFLGWRIIVLGSWLNLLLILIPISWALSISMPKSHGLIFAFCILALIPLVKLHDLSTRELALRIGGSKTGLINASLNNTVSIVVAISALRKCELRVVQSTLIGSILSKLLLVLGLCFFAGGMRFSEQGFDATATQIHSSLLSISVGAVLLPAAYHFSLSGASDTIPDWQQRNILHMSHGVSLVLLFIYVAYLIFQLWSHSHLYSDNHNEKSQRLSVPVLKKRSAPQARTDSTQDAPVMDSYNVNQSVDNLLPHSGLAPPRRPYSTSGASSSEQVLADSNIKGPRPASIDPTIRLAHGMGGYNMTRNESTSSEYSNSVSTRIGNEEKYELPEAPEKDSSAYVTGICLQQGPPEPRVSWLLTILLLIIVTIVATIAVDMLVESMDGVSEKISKEWVGLILLPTVTSIAECMTAVNVSVKDQLTLSIGVAVGSTIQTALFVIPLMVTLAWSMGKPLSLLMDPFQSLVLYIAVQTMTYVVADGKSNWLEGVILIGLYIIIAVSFWFYPGSSLLIPLSACTI